MNVEWELIKSSLLSYFAFSKVQWCFRFSRTSKSLESIETCTRVQGAPWIILKVDLLFQNLELSNVRMPKIGAQNYNYKF